MREILRIALCQHDIYWQDPERTCSMLENILPKQMEGCGSDGLPDMMVLPEFFAMGFVMDPSCAQKEGGQVDRWLEKMALSTGVAFVGSVPTVAGVSGKIYNRLLFVKPSGEREYYDKRHLFRMGGEGEIFSAGEERKIVEYNGWRILLNICYDLRFPAWSRNIGNDYDIALNVASWPAPRIEAAKILTKARAIENQSYFLFCNRVGMSPSESYTGGSMVVDYKGKEISRMRSVPALGDGGGILTAVADMARLKRFREKFPVWKDADKIELI